ncbi:MAG: hypothetical protein L3J29_05580 [Cyclobacteriaceae bacterium]|nr:hypothetical protein [Cyclobacteriaceae bacterium]
MKKKEKPIFGISRRKFLPFFGGSLLLPFIGSAKEVGEMMEPIDKTYQTLLTKDGKLVKVRSNAVNNSKVVYKKMSNKSLLSWIKKNEKEI